MTSKKNEIAKVAPAEIAAPAASIAERMADVREALESFSDLKLPVIAFKEGFTLRDGEAPVESFEGTILFTKESNVYFEGRYRPGEQAMPRCMSLDGRVPSLANPIHMECKSCPMNQYGSAKDGDGKACKNTRPTFILTDGAVIPRVLRIPPTSLPFIKSFVLGCAADHGSYLDVRARFSVFKKVESQTHWNIRVSFVRKLTAEERADVRAVREAWLPVMRESDVAASVQDDESAPSTKAPAPSAAASDDASGMQY